MNHSIFTVREEKEKNCCKSKKEKRKQIYIKERKKERGEIKLSLYTSGAYRLFHWDRKKEKRKGKRTEVMIKRERNRILYIYIYIYNLKTNKIPIKINTLLVS